jgi:hypothetical protein
MTLIILFIAIIVLENNTRALTPPLSPTYEFVGKVVNIELSESTILTTYEYEIEIMKIKENEGGDPDSIDGRVIVAFWTENVSGERCENEDIIKGSLVYQETDYRLLSIVKISNLEYYIEIYPVHLILITLSFMAITIILTAMLIIIYRKKLNKMSVSMRWEK